MTVKSRKRAASDSLYAPPSGHGAQGGSFSCRVPPAKKQFRASEDKGPDKYCHFCQVRPVLNSHRSSCSLAFCHAFLAEPVQFVSFVP
jgi:hypothetical protein